MSGGGVRLNMIPRDGGNKFSGSFFAGYQNKSFQSDNLTDDLKTRGLTTPDGIDKLSNFEASVGGPIKKDKIWFFVSARTFHLDTLPADAFDDPGRRCQTRRRSERRAGRGSAEHQQRPGAHHLAGQPEEQARRSTTIACCKNRGAAMTAGFDPATASHVWNSPIYTTGSVKMTSTVTSRLLVEGGFSTNYERYNIIYQPGIQKQRGTPEWYTHDQQAGQRARHAVERGASEPGQYPDRYAIGGSVSYVTGAHNMKVGIQDTWGSIAGRAKRQRRPARAVPERPRVPGADPEHAASNWKDELHRPTSASTRRTRGR